MLANISKKKSSLLPHTKNKLPKGFWQSFFIKNKKYIIADLAIRG